MPKHQDLITHYLPTWPRVIQQHSPALATRLIKYSSSSGCGHSEIQCCVAYIKKIALPNNGIILPHPNAQFRLLFPYVDFTCHMQDPTLSCRHVMYLKYLLIKNVTIAEGYLLINRILMLLIILRSQPFQMLSSF